MHFVARSGKSATVLTTKLMPTPAALVWAANKGKQTLSQAVVNESILVWISEGVGMFCLHLLQGTGVKTTS
jgi:hypothetical protein